MSDDSTNRSNLHWIVGGSALAAFILLVILVMNSVISATTAAYVELALAVICIVIRLMADLISRAPWGVGALSGYALLGVGALAFLWPVVHVATSKVKLNPGWAGEVVGPGDEGTIYFNQSITSVKGYWNASNIQVNVTNAAELALQPPLAPITAESSKDNWAGGISVSSKESKTRTQTLYAKVKLPDDERLVGKRLQLRISMNVSYPQLQGSNQFVNQSGAYSHDVTLELSGRKAGAAYSSAILLGFFLGAGLYSIGGFILAIAAANPVEEARPRRRRRDEDEDEDEEDERPRRRARRDEEEEERPRRRATRDEDEDERPRRRSRREEEY